MVVQNVINSISLTFLHSIRQFARHDDGWDSQSVSKGIRSHGKYNSCIEEVFADS